MTLNQPTRHDLAYSLLEWPSAAKHKSIPLSYFWPKEFKLPLVKRRLKTEETLIAHPINSRLTPALMFLPKILFNTSTRTKLNKKWLIGLDKYRHNRNNVQTAVTNMTKENDLTLINDLTFRMPQHTSSEVTVG